jgi:hypothetical protein
MNKKKFITTGKIPTIGKMPSKIVFNVVEKCFFFFVVLYFDLVKKFLVYRVTLSCEHMEDTKKYNKKK